MDNVVEAVPARTGQPGRWVVELNFAGCRIRRRADKRRYLLGLNPHTFSLSR